MDSAPVAVDPPAELLERLAGLIHDCDAEALPLARELAAHPGMATHAERTQKILEELGRYDFDAAQATLEDIH